MADGAADCCTPSTSTSSSSTFQIGETVNVKRHGNAVIVSGPISEPGHKFEGRYQVRYADGSLYHAQPSALRRFEQPPARVLVCETTDHYRAAAQAYCHPGDVVLEVGCSHGITCDLIHQRGAQVVGIDKCPELVAESRAKFPHLRFEAVDAFDLTALKALSSRGREDAEDSVAAGDAGGAGGAATTTTTPTAPAFDKICIDIGGIAELHTVMSLVGSYFRAFRGTVLIVKSKYLKTLLGNAVVWLPQKEQQQKQEKLERMQQQKQQQQKQQQKQQQVQQAEEREDSAGAAAARQAGDDAQQCNSSGLWIAFSPSSIAELC